MFWLLVGTLLASTTAAYFTWQQWMTAEDTAIRRIGFVQSVEGDNPSAYLILVGQLGYLDIFRKRRRSYFCFIYLPKQNGFVFVSCEDRLHQDE